MASLLPDIMPTYCRVIKEAQLELPKYALAPGTTSRQVLALYIPVLSPIDMELTMFCHLWGDVAIADKRRSEASARTHQLIHTVCGFQAGSSAVEEDTARVELLAKHMALFRYKSSRIAEHAIHGKISKKQLGGVAPCVHEWVQSGAGSTSAPAIALADSQLFEARLAQPASVHPSHDHVVTPPPAARHQQGWGSSSWGAHEWSSRSAQWKH